MPRKTAPRKTDRPTARPVASRDIVPREPQPPPGSPSNVELKRLIEATRVRLENWTLEVERDPNPRMVHTLKNILGHINEFTRLADEKVEYSYKSLSRQMSVLLREVATLNTAIVEALVEDDVVSSDEEERINAALRTVVQAAVELIRIVQQAFISRQRPRLTGPGTSAEQ